MSIEPCTVYVRDSNGDRTSIIDQFAEGLSATLRVNDVGTLQFEIAALLEDPNTGQLTINPDIVALMAGNTGIEIVRNSDGRQLWGGPLMEMSREHDTSTNSLQLTAHDDIEWLNRRLVLPIAPSDYSDVATQDSAYYYYEIASGTVPSTGLLQLVDDNLGPSAAAARRVAGFTLGVDPLAGWYPTLDRPWRINWSGGTVLRAAQLYCQEFGLMFAMIDGAFTVRTPLDLSATAVFEMDGTPHGGGYAIGPSLLGYTHRMAAPTANALYIATGVDASNVYRDMFMFDDAADILEWGRVEAYWANTARERGTDSDWMHADAHGYMTDKLSTEAADISTIEGPVYGIDYELGDLVTARLDDGDYIAAVNEVKITADADGWRIQPILGSRLLNENYRTALRVMDLTGRVKALETNT